MPRGGSRPGSGRPKGAKNKPKKIAIKQVEQIVEKIKEASETVSDTLDHKKMTPLEFLSAVINDDEIDIDLRFKAAQIAAPFVHPRLAEQRGSKDEKKDRAKAAGKGRFAPSAPPALKAVK